MSLVTMWIGIVPVATSWLFVGDILGALGYDQDIVDRAGSCCLLVTSLTQ